MSRNWLQKVAVMREGYVENLSFMSTVKTNTGGSGFSLTKRGQSPKKFHKINIKKLVGFRFLMHFSFVLKQTILQKDA